MIIKQGSELVLATERAVYTQNGEQRESVVGEESSDWWLDLQSRGKISNLNLEVIQYEQAVIDRFNEVKGLKVKNLGLLQDYVETGEVTDELNDATSYFLKKELVEKDLILSDLIQMLVDNEVVY